VVIKLNRKKQVYDLIYKKLNKQSYLSYIEIANVTGYHPKYVLKIKKEILENKINLVHGNKNREPVNKMTKEEKQYIINLYKRSKVSVRKFCKFYNRRSYSCIYNVLKEADLI